MGTLGGPTPMTTAGGRRCRAHNRFGDRCRQRPIIGGVVCVAHGGRAPQVKRAAAQRLAELVDEAITELARIIRHGDSDAVKLAAIKDLLDRAGFKATDRVEQSGKLVIEVLYGDVESFGQYDPTTCAPVKGSGPEEWTNLAGFLQRQQPVALAQVATQKTRDMDSER